MAEGEEKMHETRFRYIHHKVGKEVGIQQNHVQNQVHKLELNSAHTDTVVMEKLEDSVVMSLRILNINYRRITPVFFNEYSSVQRLEIGCSLSIFWLFRQLPYLPKLTAIRFGRHIFGVTVEEECRQTFRPHNSVASLEINYDHHHYSRLSATEKSSVEYKLSTVLDLAQKYFPCLQNCNIQLPKNLEVHLDDFTKHFPNIYRVGEKRTRCDDGPVTFLTSSRRKHPPSANTSSTSVPNRRSSSCSSRDSFSSPSYDRPDLLQSQLQQGSSVAYISQPKVELDPNDGDIVVLGNSSNCDSVPDVQEPAPSTANQFVPTGSTSAIFSGRRRRDKSPSMLSSLSNGNGSDSPPRNRSRYSR